MPPRQEKKKDGDGALSNLFGSKSALPPRPNNVPEAHVSKRMEGKKQKRKDRDTEKAVDDNAQEKAVEKDDVPNDNGTSSASGDDKAKSTSGAEDQPGKLSEKDQAEVDGRTVFVGNLPPDTSRKVLASIFRVWGKVVSARLRSLAVEGVKLPPNQVGNQNLVKKVCVNTGKLDKEAAKKPAQGYVVFESESSVEGALKLNNTTHNSFTIRVDHANPTNDPARSVFVGNLPYGAEEETLRAHFATGCGEEADGTTSVTAVRIIRDKETQKCKGFGYVAMSDASLVQAALRMHGTKYMKRELRVLVCGKKFKGKRGGQGGAPNKKRTFEGQRATSGEKRKSMSEGADVSGDKPERKRRARSERNATRKPGGASANSGLSKRAASEKKVNKRVKKLEKRVEKGMGKQRKK